MVSLMTEKGRSRILIVDDEPVISRSCEKIFRRAGHFATSAASGKEALHILEIETFDVVFTDLKMINIGGMEVLQTVRRKYPDTLVIVITGYATIASAVETMRSGAFDYLPKPFTPAELLAVLDRALERKRLMVTTVAGSTERRDGGFEGLIGKSPRMQYVFSLVERVAPTDCTVLIIGESGTGKDLTAKAIHNRSARGGRRFFAVDISSLTSTILESELFGHVRGSFTGAVSDRQGMFEAADGGTIFLDEIGNLPTETQGRLLRVLQQREVMPVGSTSLRHVDVRVILATNQDLKQLVTRGRFREDLYYRLNVFPIKLPSLRERSEDIPDLVMHFLAAFCAKISRPVPRIALDAIETMVNYHWPGNVRELEHAIERMVILVDGDEIKPIHVAAALFRTDSAISSIVPRDSEELKAFKKQIREASVQEVEKLFVLEALIRNNWNVSKAAREVSMQRSNFQTLMRKFGIVKPQSNA